MGCVDLEKVPAPFEINGYDHIVISNNALVSVGAIARDQAVPLVGELGELVVGQLMAARLLH